MKKNVTFVLMLSLLCSCQMKPDSFVKVMQLLDVNKPLSLENIEQAHTFILHEPNFTPQEVDTIKQAFVIYIEACASEQAYQLIEAYNAIYQSKDMLQIQIQLDSINQVALALEQYGISAYQVEGEMQASLMPIYVAKTFWNYLSEEERSWANLIQKEMDVPTLQDAAIAISYEELSYRLYECDKLITKSQLDTLLTEEINELREQYLVLLMYGSANSPAFSWQTKVMIPEVCQTIEQYINDHPETQNTEVLTQYMEIIKKYNYRASRESQQMIREFLTLSQL